ncbi:lysoplasmalogenase [Cytobacillus sp. Hz8]|uniref:lysoplasmalogenase n=1 Tax=Cytobacillus sp. Hz8 TaxID=3347168 RepID=UPI0035DCB58E
MQKHLPMMILLTGIIYIFFIPAEPILIKISFKIIPMLFIILYASQNLAQNKQKSSWFIIVGLVFCMLGDGLLIWFIIGLSAFLIGHLFYLIGFLAKFSFSWSRLPTLLPISIYAVIMGSHLIYALQSHGDQSLIWPVLLYITIISLMAWSAIMTGNGWATWGSALFVISDSILAWNKFIAGITFSDELIMITYYTAQFFMAKSLRVTPTTHREG